jgi:hypothetical protein
LQETREQVVEDILGSILQGNQSYKFPHLGSADRAFLSWFTHLMFQVLSFSIRTRDRYILSDAVQVIAPYFYAQGYRQYELKNLMYVFQQALNTHLLNRQELRQHAQRVHDFIDLNMQFLADEIEDAFDSLNQNSKPGETQNETIKSQSVTNIDEIYRFARRMESLSGDPIPEVHLELSIG